jgi:hypothetical protein
MRSGSVLQASQAVTDSWVQLLHDFKRGRFDPWEEADIQSYLYHLCLKKGIKPKKLHSERKYRLGGYEYDPRGKIADLWFESGEKSLQVNIKWGYLENLGKKIHGSWLEDIDKLSKTRVKRKSFFAVFLTHKVVNGSTRPITPKEFLEHASLIDELVTKANKVKVSLLLPFVRRKITLINKNNRSGNQ